jgi:hypothetical protein
VNLRLPDTTTVRVAILALAGGIACGHLVDPALPIDAERFNPPPVYARWWSMVESCSGLTASLDAIQFYAAPGPLTNPNNPSESIDGYWSAASNRILLDFNDTINGGVARHEMLHALLRVTGHPRRAFLDSCGGIVSCGAACVSDAGPAPVPAASIARVSPNVLEVTSEMSPGTPSASTEGGLASFTISVRNPLPYPVVVLLPDEEAGGVARTFQYGISQYSGWSTSSADLALDPSVTFFKSGETKHDVFDFLILPGPRPPSTRISGLGENGLILSAGNYTFRGDYGGNRAPDRGVVLEP